MQLELVTQYPFWYIVFCILLGLLFAVLTYYRYRKAEEPAKIILYLLFGLRTITVSILAFLLLSPFIKVISSHIEKPILILVADNSKSVIAANKKDTKTLKLKVNELREKLSERYEVVVHSFDEKLNGDTLNFKGETTCFSSMFEDLEAKYSNKNIGALVVLSDGIYNQGQNPIYLKQLPHVPVYSVILGDTTEYKDLLIKEMYYNNISYVGNQFPVELVVDCKACSNEKTTLTVFLDDEKIKETDLQLHKVPLTEKVMLKAEKKGMRKLRIELSTIKGEKVLLNNSREVYVEVLDGKQKILLLSKASHPDVGAIKSIVEKNENYQIDVFQYDNFKEKIDQYTMVLLHQLPDDYTKTDDLIKKIITSKIGLCLVLGTQMNYAQLAKINIGIKWLTPFDVRSFQDAYPVLHEKFSLFNLSKETYELASDLPPLKTPYTQFVVPRNASHLAFQKIGSVTTETPLITFFTYEDSKICLIAGEGFWRWKLHDYLKFQSEIHYQEIIQKTIQYLALKSDKSKFRINHKKKYIENEEIIFDVELYNDSYELTNEPEVELKVKNKLNKVFVYSFDKYENKYRLNLTGLAPGKYLYTATTSLAEKKLVKEGVFVIEELNLEEMNTRADFNLMNQWAIERGGESFFLSNTNNLIEKINEREDIKPLEHSTVNLKELVHQKELFFLLITFLSVEWLFRKRSGLS